MIWVELLWTNRGHILLRIVLQAINNKINKLQLVKFLYVTHLANRFWALFLITCRQY